MQTDNLPDPTPKAPVRRNRKPILGAVITIVVLGVLGLVPRERQAQNLKKEASSIQDTIPSVSVVRLSSSSSASDLVLPSNIQAIDQTTINARTSGYVSQRLVDIGSHVTKGQLLAVVESPELDQQLGQTEADALRSRAGLGAAQADSAKLRAAISAAKSDESRSEAARMQAVADQAHLRAKEQQAESAVKVARAHETEASKRYAGAQAELSRNRAALQLASKTLTRWKELEKSQAVSGQDVDEKQAAFDSSQAQVDAGEANVSSARAAALAAHEAVQSALEEVTAAKADLNSGLGRIQAAESAIASSKSNITAARAGYSVGVSGEAIAAATISSSLANVRRVQALQSFERITAPFSGVITARNVDVGDLVNSSSGGSGASDQGNAVTRTGLFGLAKTDVLRAQINVPEDDAAAVHQGQATEVTVGEYPNRVFHGTVFRVSGALDSSSRTLLVEVQVPNADGALKPGMYAQIKFQNSKGAASLWLPANALIFNGAGTRVAVVSSEGRLHYVVVKLGRDLGSKIEVLSGLSGDETIVANPDDSLPESAKVNPVPEAK